LTQDATQKRQSLLPYAVLAMPLSFAGLPIYLIAPDYYSVNHGMSLVTLGFCLLILRFFDAFIDPLLGRLIDRYFLHFRHFMSLSALVLGLGILMLFWVPEISAKVTLLWFCLAIFITTFAYSLLSIGYGVQGALWSQHHSEQVSITSIRELFSIIGLILAVTLPFYLFSFLPADTSVRVVSIFMTTTLAFCYLLYRRFPVNTKTKSYAKKSKATKTHLCHSNKGDKSNFTPLQKLYLIYGISTFASAIPAVLVIFFVRDYLGLGNASGLFLLLYFLSGACSISLWRRIALNKGKLFAWKLSMVLAVVSFTFVLFVSPGDYLLYALVCLGSGFALGADLSLPPALLSELATENSEQPKNIGMQYSGLTCLNKLSLALAAGLSLPILGFIGFEPAAENTPDAMTKLLWLYGGLPCLLKMLAILFAHSYPFSTFKKAL